MNGNTVGCIWVLFFFCYYYCNATTTKTSQNNSSKRCSNMHFTSTNTHTHTRIHMILTRSFFSRAQIKPRVGKTKKNSTRAKMHFLQWWVHVSVVWVCERTWSVSEWASELFFLYFVLSSCILLSCYLSHAKRNKINIKPT